MTKQICLPFPIRRDFIAQIIVPANMTQDEADRLCAFVMFLAQPEPVEAINWTHDPSDLTTMFQDSAGTIPVQLAALKPQ